MIKSNYDLQQSSVWSTTASKRSILSRQEHVIYRFLGNFGRRMRICNQIWPIVKSGQFRGCATVQEWPTLLLVRNGHLEGITHFPIWLLKCLKPTTELQQTVYSISVECQSPNIGGLQWKTVYISEVAFWRRHHWYNYTYHDTRQPYSLYICICRKKIGRDSPPCVPI